MRLLRLVAAVAILKLAQFYMLRNRHRVTCFLKTYVGEHVHAFYSLNFQLYLILSSPKDKTQLVRCSRRNMFSYAILCLAEAGPA